MKPTRLRPAYRIRDKVQISVAGIRCTYRGRLFDGSHLIVCRPTAPRFDFGRFHGCRCPSCHFSFCCRCLSFASGRVPATSSRHRIGGPLFCKVALLFCPFLYVRGQLSPAVARRGRLGHSGFFVAACHCHLIRVKSLPALRRRWIPSPSTT